MRPRSLRVRNAGKKKELFVQRRSVAFFIFLAISALALLISYTVFDNLRVQVDRVDVSIPTLPKALEGFTILPISDLHNKTFGEGQGDIVKAVGTAKFDVILFLGDMTDRSRQDPEAFYALIDALAPSGKPMFYAKGNHDPESEDLSGGTCKPSAYVQGALDRGVVLLDRPYKLKDTADGGIWLWPTERLCTDIDAAIETAELNIERETLRGVPEGDAMAAYYAQLIEQYQAVLHAREQMGPADIHIAAEHFPMTPARFVLLQDADGPSPTLSDVDLLLAGHYHAGQVRFPMLGAPYVHAPDLPRGGWFPAQDSIAGLTRIGTLQQYICRGLGASGPAPVKFRLFNTPEIALVKLTSRVE